MKLSLSLSRVCVCVYAPHVYMYVLILTSTSSPAALKNTNSGSFPPMYSISTLSLGGTSGKQHLCAHTRTHGTATRWGYYFGRNSLMNRFTCRQMDTQQNVYHTLTINSKRSKRNSHMLIVFPTLAHTTTQHVHSADTDFCKSSINSMSALFLPLPSPPPPTPDMLSFAGTVGSASQHQAMLCCGLPHNRTHSGLGTGTLSPNWAPTLNGIRQERRSKSYSLPQYR